MYAVLHLHHRLLVSAMKAVGKLVLRGMPHKPVPVKYAEPPPKLLL